MCGSGNQELLLPHFFERNLLENDVSEWLSLKLREKNDGLGDFTQLSLAPNDLICYICSPQIAEISHLPSDRGCPIYGDRHFL